MYDWTVDALVPKTGKITELDRERYEWFESDYEHWRPWDVVAFSTNGFRAAITKIQGARVWTRNMSGHRGNMLRTVDHITTRPIPHLCERNACEWVTEEYDEDADEDHNPGEPWLSHDFRNDFERLAMPFYDVRFALIGDCVINIGPMYVQGTMVNA